MQSDTAFGRLFARLIGAWLMIAMAAVPRAQAAPKKVLRIQAVKVQGQLQKPQAFYILQRSNLNFEGMDAKQTFIPRIIQSVDDKPF